MKITTYIYKPKNKIRKFKLKDLSLDIHIYIPLHGDLHLNQYLEKFSLREREIHREKEGLEERKKQTLVYSWRVDLICSLF